MAGIRKHPNLATTLVELNSHQLAKVKRIQKQLKFKRQGEAVAYMVTKYKDNIEQQELV